MWIHQGHQDLKHNVALQAKIPPTPDLALSQSRELYGGVKDEPSCRWPRRP